MDEKVKYMKEYEYRVMAQNIEGNSKPSESTGSIKARPLNEKPK